MLQMYVCVPSWLMLLFVFVFTDGTGFEEEPDPLCRCWWWSSLLLRVCWMIYILISLNERSNHGDTSRSLYEWMFNDNPARKLHWLLGVKQGYMNECLTTTQHKDYIVYQCKQFYHITSTSGLSKITALRQNVAKCQNNLTVLTFKW